jgi:prepilin-type N-terminal cleavage/methylation domain-containing protein
VAKVVARRRRRLLSDESGLSLLELVVTMSLLGIVLLAVTSVLSTVNTAFARQGDRSLSNDNARLAAEELDREIRSGNLLYDPRSSDVTKNPTGDPSGMQLIIYTQTNANRRDPGNRCVQWKIVNKQLQRRDFTPDQIYVGPWRIVAENIVNNTVSPVVPAFGLDPNSSQRTLVVTILSQVRSSSGAAVRIQEFVTGRDTEYGYPNNICASIPP